MTEKQKKEILDNYLCNEMYKLKKVCFPILSKLGGVQQKDEDDFYSLASITLWRAIENYKSESGIPFEGFYKSCLQKKFTTELRDRNRDVRKANNGQYVCSINEINTNGNTLEDLIPDNNTVEDIFKEKNREYSNKMERYLSRLSEMQKTILELISIGYTPSEIISELHIGNKEYSNSIAVIKSYENINILL